jgi:Virulence factor
MARYRIVHWREIPSLVEAVEGDQIARVPLSQRFQDLIDAVAMRQGASDTDAYLAGWGQTADLERPGSVEQVASEVAARLEGEFQDLAARRLLPPPA